MGLWDWIVENIWKNYWRSPKKLDISIDYWEKLFENADRKVKHYEKRVDEYTKKYKNHKTKENKEMLEHYQRKLYKWERKLRHRGKRWNQASHNYKSIYGG